MKQFVFLHTDIQGNLWKHVHFSYVAAVKARNAWQSMRQLVTSCSKYITEEARDMLEPCIVGLTIKTVIPLEDRLYE